MAKVSSLFFGVFLCAFIMPYALCPMPSVAAADDPFLFDNFAIVDSTDTDVTAPPVSMNTDAATVSVGGFDISGIMLGMPFETVHTIFFRSGSLYTPRKKDSIVYTMAKDWKYNLDYECRQQKIYAPAALERCINTLARSRGLLYASELHLERPSTGETIDVYFTSNMTENLVWRVVYKNDVNEVEGAAEKFENQREKKILAFWGGVLDKYGAPNSGNDKWISSTNAYDPMMTAYYGSLDLVDQGRNATDITANINAARENFRAKPYAF
jgi:hypothetical protein